MMKILDSRKRLNDLMHEFKLDYEHGIVSNGPWMGPFRNELIRANKCADVLKLKVVKHPIKTTKRMPTKKSTLSSEAVASTFTTEK
ncbi:MAG: hypothetical protein WCS73_05690 [Lentisphaeria bacterium]